MRFVDANMNARKFTTWAPFEEPLPDGDRTEATAAAGSAEQRGLRDTGHIGIAKHGSHSFFRDVNLDETGDH